MSDRERRNAQILADWYGDTAEEISPIFERAAEELRQELAVRSLPKLTSRETEALFRYPHRVRNDIRQRLTELGLVSGLSYTVWGETVRARLQRS
jgi:hypothetical protein